MSDLPMRNKRRHLDIRVPHSAVHTVALKNILYLVSELVLDIADDRESRETLCGQQQQLPCGDPEQIAHQQVGNISQRS